MGSRHVMYYNEPGADNTEDTLRTALDVAISEDLECLVVASGGSTLLEAVRMLPENSNLQVIGVTLQAGTWPKYDEPDWEKIQKAEELGAKALTCTHALMGNVEAAIRDKFGGLPPVELIAHTLYTFSQGTKVAVEIALSAVDAGLIPVGQRTVSVAGSGGGADTALLVRATSTVNFFDFRIEEILCKPR